MTSTSSTSSDQRSSGNVEASVLQVWQRVLDRPVDHDSDFFALGGNSLAAISISTDLEQLLGVRVRLRLIFDHPRLNNYMREVTRIVQEVA